MNNNEELITGLREFAAFLEARPEFPQILESGCGLFLLGVDAKELPTVARLLGNARKDATKNSDMFYLRRNFGPIRFTTYTNREQVCHRVKVGEKVIPAKPEEVIPAQTIPATEERIEDVYEWRCPESILNGEPVD